MKIRCVSPLAMVGVCWCCGVCVCVCVCACVCVCVCVCVCACVCECERALSNRHPARVLRPSAERQERHVHTFARRALSASIHTHSSVAPSPSTLSCTYLEGVCLCVWCVCVRAGVCGLLCGCEAERGCAWIKRYRRGQNTTSTRRDGAHPDDRRWEDVGIGPLHH